MPTVTLADPQRLGPVRYLPFIAGSYASKRIIPRSPDDLADYMLVQYQGYQPVAGLQAWNEIIERRSHGVIQVPSPEMLRELVRWSGCIGLLPASINSQNRNFVPLGGIFGQPLTLDVWIGVNPASPLLSQARQVAGMIVQGYAD